MPNPVHTRYSLSSVVAMLMTLTFGMHVHAAESISLTGSLQPLACTAVCGACCGSYLLTDESDTLSFQVGISFVDITGISDDSSLHRFTGSFYQASGQCNVNQCTLFAIESVDEPLVPETVYDPQTGQMHIPSARVGDSEERYSLTLSPPFHINSLVQLLSDKKLGQGESCVEETTTCHAGLKCVEYYGIAGANGPLFKTCEIPCGFSASTCPSGQSCVVVADGPGQVCQ
jgi:hypothetical protein